MPADCDDAGCPWPASESLQGMKPREVTGGRAAGAMGFARSGSCEWQATVMIALAEDVAVDEQAVASVVLALREADRRTI